MLYAAVHHLFGKRRNTFAAGVIGRDYFGHLPCLSGDQGARAIFNEAGADLKRVTASVDEMLPISDTPDDYARLTGDRRA